MTHHTEACDTSFMLDGDTCRIIWIRHGETAWNAEKRFQGHLDIPLNETGLQQARRLAGFIAQPDGLSLAFCAPPQWQDNNDAGRVDNNQHPKAPRPDKHLIQIDALISSDLSRAVATALCISNKLGLALTRLSGLRERNYGELAGLTGDEMAKRFPQAWKNLTGRKPDAPLPGGESLLEFNDRIISNARVLAQQNRGKTVCVVVHGGVLDCIYRHANRIDLQSPRRWLLANTSLNIVDHGIDRWQVRLWGNTDHLTGHSSDEVDGRIT